MLETIRNRTGFDKFMKHNMNFGFEVVRTDALSISYIRLASNGQKCAFLTRNMMERLRTKGHLVAPRRIDKAIAYTLDYKPCAVCGFHLFKRPDRAEFSIDTTGVNVSVGPKVVKRYGENVCLWCAHKQDIEKISNGETIAFGFTSSGAKVPLAITNDGMTINYSIEGATPKDESANLWHVTFKDHIGREWEGIADHNKHSAVVAPLGVTW